MFRLARRLVQPRAISRSLRAQRPPKSPALSLVTHGRSLSHFKPTRPTQNQYDESAGQGNGLPTPAEELSVHLKRPEVRRGLKTLNNDEATQLSSLVHSIYDNRTGAERMEILDQINDLLSLRGLGLKYTQRLPPIEHEPETDFLKEWEELTGEKPQRRPFPRRNRDEHSEATSSTSSSSHVQKAANPGEDSTQYPNLMTPDPLLDARDVVEFPPTEDCPYHNRVIVRNHTSIFNAAAESQGATLDEDYTPTRTDETEEASSSLDNLPLTMQEQRKLYRFPLITKRVTQQTGKGKIHRVFVMTVVGNGDGMVGLGQAKDADGTRASMKAFAQAVRNMDWVERFEKRTIWTEMETKLGATQVIMRPRPVGFGLRCNPYLHQVLKAAGIKDISAKVWGSRNKMNVIKAAFRMLQSGHAPLAMGDGVGGPGSKLSKGSGLRSKSDIERERGRQLISLRK